MPFGYIAGHKAKQVLPVHPIALLKRRREIRPSLLPPCAVSPIGGVEIVCYVLCKNTGSEKMSTVGRKRGVGAWGADISWYGGQD